MALLYGEGNPEIAFQEGPLQELRDYEEEMERLHGIDPLVQAERDRRSAEAQQGGQQGGQVRHLVSEIPDATIAPVIEDLTPAQSLMREVQKAIADHNRHIHTVIDEIRSGRPRRRIRGPDLVHISRGTLTPTLNSALPDAPPRRVEHHGEDLL